MRGAVLVAGPELSHPDRDIFSHGVRLSASRQPSGGRALATTSLRHAAYLRNQTLCVWSASVCQSH